MFQVIPEGKLALAVRDLERTDSEVRDNKHLLAQRGKPEGKNSSLVLPDHPDDQEGQHHAGQRVAEAARGVPQDVLPFDIAALVEQAGRQFVHFIHHLMRLSPLAEILNQKYGNQHPRHIFHRHHGL